MANQTIQIKFGPESNFISESNRGTVSKRFQGATLSTDIKKQEDAGSGGGGGEPPHNKPYVRIDSVNALLTA
jgi:hypothetical protein